MTIKVISFLGVGPYSEAAYVYRNQPYVASFFPLALAQFCQPRPDRWLICATDEAANTPYYESLKQQLDFTRLPIPLGKNEKELWEIFKIMVSEIEKSDRVIFDITHGLRSLPFVVFLAAAYLKVAREIAVEGIFYGAFDLRNRNVIPNEAPVFELTPFVTLLDWLTATNQFVKTGNAADLATELGRSGQASLAETVQNIAAGLHLLRPGETSSAAAKLSSSLAAVKDQLPSPFMLLADNLLENYGRFGQAEPSDTSETQLGYQLEMIYWYHKSGQLVHALSLGREWVVSLLCSHFNLEERDSAGRAEMEFLLSGGKSTDSNTGEVRESKYRDDWPNIVQGKELRKLWGDPYKLANLRNDVLHSGFRQNPKPAAVVKAETDQALNKLYEIAAAWGFPSHPPLWGNIS